MSTWVEDYAHALEACVAAEVGTLCGWGIVAGADVSIDFCGGCDSGECGQWWVSVQSIYPFTAFPSPDEAATCATELGATILVGIARCISINEDGSPTDHEQHAAAFTQQMDDALALHRAIACCQQGWEVVVGSWVPLGPEGGCIGGSWTLNVTRR